MALAPRTAKLFVDVAVVHLRLPGFLRPMSAGWAGVVAGPLNPLADVRDIAHFLLTFGRMAQRETQGAVGNVHPRAPLLRERLRLLGGPLSCSTPSCARHVGHDTTEAITHV